MCQGTSFFRVLAEQKNNTIKKEHRQHMQYGGRDSKTMKGKLLTGVGLLLIIIIAYTVYCAMVEHNKKKKQMKAAAGK